MRKELYFPPLQIAAQTEALLDRQHELLQRREHLRQSISQEARCPRRDWQADFAWDARALSLLRTVFGLKDYRWVEAQCLIQS